MGSEHAHILRPPETLLGETVQQAAAAGGNKISLAASARGMRGIPGNIAAAGAVVMTHLRAAFAFARPVLAGVVCTIGEGFSLGCGTSQDVMLIRRIAKPADGVTFFCDSGAFVDEIADAGQLCGVAVQIGQALGNAHSLGVKPGTLPNPVPCIHCRLAVGGIRAEVSVPRFIPGAGCRG